MLNTRELSLPQHYKSLKQTLARDEFYTSQGRELITHLLQGQEFSSNVDDVRNIQDNLKSSDSQIALLTRIVLNLALLPRSPMGNMLRKKFEPHAFEYNKTPLNCDYLNFDDIDFNKFTTAECEALCQVLALSPRIESLCLYLKGADTEKIKMIFSALYHSSIQTIAFTYNDLELLDQESMQVFFNCISRKNIAFFRTYVDKAPSFDIGEENISALKNALVNNYHWYSYIAISFNPMPENAWQACKDIHQRNQALSKINSYINDILKSRNKHSCTYEMECCFEQSDVFINSGEMVLKNHPFQNQDEKTFAQKLFEKEKYQIFERRNQMLIQFVDSMLSMVPYVEIVDAGKMNVYIRRMALASTLGDIKFKFISQIIDVLLDQQKSNEALKILLSIPSSLVEKDKQSNARNLAFRIAYNHHFDGCALTAFINALPCYLNEEGLLKLDNESSRASLDGYLVIAANIAHPGILSDEHRLVLMKYVLLQSIKSRLPVFSMTPNLFNEQTENLRGQIEKLPIIAHIDDIAQLSALNDAWNKVALISEKSSDKNLRLLFKAIEHMGKSRIELRF